MNIVKESNLENEKKNIRDDISEQINKKAEKVRDKCVNEDKLTLIAFLTNNFVPCSGRFPTLIAIATVFLVAKGESEYSLIPALSITGLVIVGISVILLVSYDLSKTILKGVPSTVYFRTSSL